MGKSLERQALDRMGKNWSKASETREKLLHNTCQFARFLQDKYHLERIENLKPAMITAYAASMTDQGLSGSTMANRMTAVREVCAAIGKQGICAKENAAYGIERVRVNPQHVNVDKLTEIRGALAERAADGDRVAKMMVAADGLREAFGLRSKESLMSREVTHAPPERGGVNTFKIKVPRLDAGNPMLQGILLYLWDAFSKDYIISRQYDAT